MSNIKYPLDVRIDIISQHVCQGDATKTDGDKLHQAAYEVHNLMFDLEETKLALKKAQRSGNWWFGLAAFLTLASWVQIAAHWGR